MRRIVEFIAAVRSDLFARLGINSGGAASSSGASSSIPTAIAYEVITPPAPLLDSNQSLQWNFAHQFEGRLKRPLSLGEHVALHEGMSAALATHAPGNADFRRAVLESPLYTGRDGHRRRDPAIGVRSRSGRGGGTAARRVMDGPNHSSCQRTVHSDRDALCR